MTNEIAHGWFDNIVIQKNLRMAMPNDVDPSGSEFPSRKLTDDDVREIVKACDDAFRALS